MRFAFFAALLCVAAAELQLSASGSWTYDAQDQWPGVCRNGSKQSPIDIHTKDAVRVNMTELRFHDYDTSDNFWVAATGKTVRIYGFEKRRYRRPYIEEGGLDGRYYLDEIHFHWYRKGEHNASEHSIDGTHYPIEVHFVHRGKIEGQEHIAVIAVFVQPDETSEKTDHLLNSLVWMIERTDNVKSSAGPWAPRKVPSFNRGTVVFYPEWLLPADRTRFYRYEGSLTTPNCDEVVTWTVMEEPLSIQSWVTDKLTNLRNRNGPTEEFVHNQRRQQDLNGRCVFLRDPTATKTTLSCNAAHIRCAFWPLVIAIAALLIVGAKIPDGICF